MFAFRLAVKNDTLALSAYNAIHITNQIYLSGGEGALLAAAGSPFGIGSDIGGSIRLPSMFNGIFGHKPSRSIVSNDKMYPVLKTKEEEHMLGVGPMCKYACDLLPVMKLIVKEEKLKELRLDEPVDVRKLKVYYQENDLGSDFTSPVDEDLQIALQKVVNYFKNDLKVEVQKVKISRVKNMAACFTANMSGIGSMPFKKLLAKNPNEEISPLWEIGKMIFGGSNHTFISMLTTFKQRFDPKSGSEEQRVIFEERDKLIEDFKNMLKDDMSIFLYPTHPCVAPYHTETVIRSYNITYTALINVLGMPGCNVPLGIGSEGLPLGIQVVANYNNDRLCIAAANELEKAFGGWVNAF